MQLFLTIFAGVFTFVGGQILLKLIVEPVHDMKRVISEIAHKLIMYANIYANPKPAGDEQQEAALREFRDLSSKLQSAMYLVPGYWWSSRIFGLPAHENIVKASKNLIGLSNGHSGVLQNQAILNCYSSQKIKQALGIYISPDEWMDPKREKSFIQAKEGY